MDGPADLIITDATVYPGGPSEPWPTAVAVKDGRIAAIGSLDDIRDVAGSTTDVRSLPGRLVCRDSRTRTSIQRSGVGTCCA